MESWDEANVTDIEICPDGRIHVFGASQEMMALLQSLGWQDDRRRRLHDRQMSSNGEVITSQPTTVSQQVSDREAT